MDKLLVAQSEWKTIKEECTPLKEEVEYEFKWYENNYTENERALVGLMFFIGIIVGLLLIKLL